MHLCIVNSCLPKENRGIKPVESNNEGMSYLVSQRLISRRDGAEAHKELTSL
jgi:hypothetical protein